MHLFQAFFKYGMSCSCAAVDTISTEWVSCCPRTIADALLCEYHTLSNALEMSIVDTFIVGSRLLRPEMLITEHNVNARHIQPIVL